MRREFEVKTERRRDREKERRRDREKERLPSLRRSFSPSLLLSLSLSFCLSASHSPLPTPHSLFASAQRRPTLRPAARDYLAGKFVLITRDERPQSLQQPRLLARVADHDLITPPSRVMTDADALIEWAKGVD